VSADEPSVRAWVLAFVEAHWRELTLRDACRLSLDLVDASTSAQALGETAAVG